MPMIHHFLSFQSSTTGSALAVPPARNPRLYFTYDKWGNYLHEAFYGIDNTPVVNQQGYAKAIYTYDIHNHRIEATYYDVKGGPISLEQ